MNGYIVTIIIAFIFGPILALPVMFFGLFNIMDFALYSFPIFFFCIMGYRSCCRGKNGRLSGSPFAGRWDIPLMDIKACNSWRSS
ncbi:Uncharacterised protein [Klebsiella pneumoniae]|nr:Uncharacterised protein [Klebsiella pneumoniae]